MTWPTMATKDYGLKAKRTTRAISWLIAALLGLCLLPMDSAYAQSVSDEPAVAPEEDDEPSSRKLYVRKGSDPTFRELLKRKAFPIGKNSTNGVTGSTIHVNHKLLNKAPNSEKPIPQAINIHTLCNSSIKRADFDKWTRWYQEDSSTQVFRLFKGEHNVRNSRENAARVEAFSKLAWGRGKWHSWQGTYTIVKPHSAMIFQAKNDTNEWSVSIGMNDDGDIRLNHRRHQEDKWLARDMVGKRFTLRIRDNGHDYEVYFNEKKVGEGSYDRPKGKTKFRWGMYVGNNEMRHDAMLFVTGAQFE